MRLRYLLLEALTLLICIAGLYQIWEKAGVPISVNDKLRVVQTDTIIEDAIRTGDTLTSINTIIVRTPDEAEFLYNGMKIGDTVQLKLMGSISPEPYTIPVVLRTFYTTSYFVLIIFSSGIFFGIALFVRRRRPDGKDIQVFHALCLGMAMLILTTPGRYTIPLGIGYIVSAVFFAAYSFAPVFLFFLSRIFPRDRSQETPLLFQRILIFAGILTLALSFSFFIACWSDSLSAFRFHFVLFQTVQVWFVVCVVATIISFGVGYRAANEEAERRKILWIALGVCSSALGYLDFWLLPQFFLGHAIVPEEAIILLSVIAPITFGIALIRYRVMDITLLINRSAVFVAVSLFILVIYASCFGIAIMLGGQLGTAGTFGVSGLAVIINVMLFAPVRGMIQRIVDKSFFRVQYNYRSAQKILAEKTSMAETNEEVGAIVTENIITFLAVERLSIVYRNEDVDTWECITSTEIKNLEQVAQQLEHETTPLGLLQIVEHDVEITRADEPKFIAMGICLLYPILNDHKKLVGMLAVGEKKSGTRFSAEDCDLLLGAGQLAIAAVERILLRKKIALEQEESKRLAELNQLKSYFVSGVSHELKTPLTAIRMFAEMLRGRTEGTKSQEYLDIIEGESARLGRLIDNVLDFAKIERGLKDYRKSPVELKSIVENVLSVMHYEIQKESFTLETKFADELLTFDADSDAIGEAIMNIISNALKYSSSEHYICITTFRENNFVCVKIQDKGVGIAPQFIDTIFEPFSRLKDDATQRAGGAGLGLSLVRHIVSGHNGHINVESSLGNGTTFTLFFPSETV
ncbi:MAG: HAMP domain-containing histidine kinase [Ignavibacteria bacterium]|nr:HAMP domain-containing histidine kinase [Ignavibacteria bacterium]